MNKKLTALSLALMLGLSTAAMAKHHYNDKDGGYVGDTDEVVSIKQALTMPDDADVTLRGKIEKRIKKDKYLFRDDTGSIMVEIDNDVWEGQVVGPNDTVTIMGEIDKDDNYNMIDVERLIKK